MKLKTISKLGGLSLLAVLTFMPQLASAAGTAANTSINNRATIDYEVSGTAQTPIESSPAGNVNPGVGNGADTTFLVDNLIAFTVTEESGSYTSVAIGAVQQDVGFRLRNNGNETQDFLLEGLDSTPDPFGGAENFNATGGFTFFVDDGDLTFNVADTLVTFIDELAPDTEVLIFVVSNIPGTVTGGDIAAVTMIAQVAQGGVATVQGAVITNDDNGRTSPGGVASDTGDNPAAVDLVFGDDPGGLGPEDVGFNFVTSLPTGVIDPARNGQHADTDAYIVIAAELTITKSSVVLSDPINGASNPKAIPGAIIEFTITVDNGNGAAPPAALAQLISIEDDLTAMLGNFSFITTAYDGDASCTAAPCGMLATAPQITLAGNVKALSNAADGAEQDGVGGDFSVAVPNGVGVQGLQLADGETGTVTFQVQITP